MLSFPSAKLGGGFGRSQGLEALHKANFLHGDPKPENDLITKTIPGEEGEEVEVNEDVVKISDYGRAKKLDEEGGHETFKYSGNTRFAPPEGTSSKQGEVYAAALKMIRTFEEELDIDKNPIMSVQGKKDCKPHPSRRGIEKYMLESKTFLCYENKGSSAGRIKNAYRRNKVMGKPDRVRESQQTHELKTYITLLCSGLKKEGKISDREQEELEELLHDMTKSYSYRPTMTEVVERYNEIFPSPAPEFTPKLDE